MRLILNRLLLSRYMYASFTNSKRFAGHSKWANIKHTKQEKDTERALRFHHITLQMKIAIQEGGSTKPNDNLRLAQLIEQAKKINMPATSIKSFLEKMESRKDKAQKGIIEIRGPNGYVMIVCFATSNLAALKIELNQKLKKTSGKVAESSVRNMFTHMGSIIVEGKGDLEQATENAINVGAEDVEEFEENDRKYFQFKCDARYLSKIKNLLENHQYCVLSAEEDYIPHVLLQLNESDLQPVAHIRDKVLSLDDVSHIYDNVE